MPQTTTIMIDRDQRDGIYELVRNHISSIEDLWIALERTGDYLTAERLGEEFAEDFRLLEDIGWRPVEDREAIELTMPGEELRVLMVRLREEATEVLIEHGGEAEAARRDTERDRRFQVGHEACGIVLLGLGSISAG